MSRTFCLMISLFAALFAAPGFPARAGLVFVASRSAFGGTDSIDWSKLGPTGTHLTSPVSATSTGGVGVTATVLNPTLVGATSSLDVGTLSALASLHDYWHRSVLPTAPVTLSKSFEYQFMFDQPLKAVGADFSAYLESTSTVLGGDAFVQFLDSAGSVLGQQSIALTVLNPPGLHKAYFDATFVGARSDIADIASMVLHLDFSWNYVPNLVNTVQAEIRADRIDLDAGVAATPVPEPVSALLFGLVGLAFMVCKGIS